MRLRSASARKFLWRIWILPRRARSAARSVVQSRRLRKLNPGYYNTVRTVPAAPYPNQDRECK